MSGAPFDRTKVDAAKERVAAAFDELKLSDDEGWIALLEMTCCVAASVGLTRTQVDERVRKTLAWARTAVTQAREGGG